MTYKNKKNKVTDCNRLKGTVNKTTVFIGYITEHDDPNDNRAKQIRITKKGEDLIHKCYILSLSVSDPVPDDIKKLKNSDGSDLQVWGSGELIQLLLKNDLVDELRLVNYPLTLGQGQKLLANGTRPQHLN